jgi:hypothetical protein
MRSRFVVGTPQLLLLVLSGSIAFVIGEVAVRWLGPASGPGAAALMQSSAHVLLDDRGAVRHIPNETVRLVAVYGETVEFDVTVRTNNLGFVDHRDYPVSASSRHQYAFVGDSFVYGMGAEPWVPKLRDALRAAGHDLEIYNLGVNGASVQHFRKLLSSVSAELPITHIVAIAITNDFYRPWWVPVMTPSGVEICQDDGARCRPAAATIAHDTPLAEILAQIRELNAEADRQMSVDPFWKRALWRSRLYLLMRGRIRQIVHRFGPPETVPSGFTDPRRLGINLEALAGIRADFPIVPITLVHFPQKEEVQGGRYELDLEETAARLNVDYFPALTRCSWSLDQFYVLDAHPTAAGYQTLAECLSRYLFADSKQSNP